MNRLQYAHTSTLVGYFGLLVLILAWNTWLSPPSVLPVALVLIMFAGPLLLPLRGLLHGKLYTYKWVNFLAMFYFVHGVVEAYSNPPERLLAILEVIFSVVFFLGSVFYTRYYADKTTSP